MTTKTRKKAVRRTAKKKSSRGPGRPKTLGASTPVALHLEAETVEGLDDVVTEINDNQPVYLPSVNRSSVMRAMLKYGIKNAKSIFRK